MAAVGSDTVQGAVRDQHLREQVGLGLAVAWVLTHLWQTSPLPYGLDSATGLVLYGNTAQERSLLLGFALCLAFVVFQPRFLKVPGWTDAVLAAVAGVAGSSVFWNYAAIVKHAGDPTALALAVGGCGILMLFLAGLRVLGWLGVTLIGLILAAHLAPLQMGYPAPPGLRDLSGFVEVHWLQSGSVFGLQFGLVAVTGFSFMLLGVGLDVLGLGRSAARRALRPLAARTDVDRLAIEHPCARNLWAMAVLVYMIFPDPPSGSAFGWLWQWVSPLSLGFVLYAVSQALGARRLSAHETRPARRPRLAAGGMLLAAALILAAMMKLAFVASVLVFSDLALDLPRSVTPVVWLLAFTAASLLLTLKATARALRVSALLPIGLFFWLTGVERYSPDLSGSYAVLLLLFVMIEEAALEARAEGKPLAAAPSLFLKRSFLPLCQGQARIMVRVVIVVALLGMLLPWTLHLVNLLTY